MSDLSDINQLSMETWWPLPPWAMNTTVRQSLMDAPCQITGLNNHVLSGCLEQVDLANRHVKVLMPNVRNPLKLGFDQFRTLVLTEPLSLSSMFGVNIDMQVDALDFRIWLKQGEVLEGKTLGHVQQAEGLFLFLPEQKTSFQRMFIPAASLQRFEVGPRLGDMLVANEKITADQVDEAVEMQQQLRTRKLGEILMNNAVLTPEQLLQAIDQQARMPMVRIGEALVALDLISQAQLDEALSQQQQDRTLPLGEVLIQLHMVTRDDVRLALARKMGYPMVDLSQFPVENEALRQMPYSTASRADAVPIVLREGLLVVAMSDPSDRRALSELSFVTQCRIVPVLAQQTDLTELRTQMYRRIGADLSDNTSTMHASESSLALMAAEDSNLLVANLEKEGHSEGQLTEDDRPIEQSDNSLVRLINTMIIEAHNQGVSDIHIETYPGRQKLKIRFRKDGILQPYLALPASYRNALVARIKIMCDLDISERRRPQDGKINFARFMPNHPLELRVATIPTNAGMEDVVMRLLTSAKPLPLDKIGLSPDNLQRLQHAMQQPYGMILCVGPTGSGKTTTLHSALGSINTPDRKIWTAEDPVEITQAGLRQVQVNPKIDWTFAKALRAFLRADPDVIMVGEMRDIETAGMAIEASLTGHLVLSTLHTNSAPETVTRLLDMGMDPFNFGDALLVVLAQRLVRRLCTHCRQSEPASAAEVDEWLSDYLHHCPDDAQFDRQRLHADWLERHGHEGQLLKYHSVGCEQCQRSGYAGRAGLHELMTVTRPLRRLIQTGARSEALLAQAMLDGMRTLRQDGLEKVLSGVTSLDEVRACSHQ